VRLQIVLLFDVSIVVGAGGVPSLDVQWRQQTGRAVREAAIRSWIYSFKSYL
jgi:hypothetical protein